MADESTPDIESLAKRCVDLWQDHAAAMASDPELNEIFGFLMGMMVPSGAMAGLMVSGGGLFGGGAMAPGAEMGTEADSGRGSDAAPRAGFEAAATAAEAPTTPQDDAVEALKTSATFIKAMDLLASSQAAAWSSLRCDSHESTSAQSKETEEETERSSGRSTPPPGCVSASSAPTKASFAESPQENPENRGPSPHPAIGKEATSALFPQQAATGPMTSGLTSDMSGQETQNPKTQPDRETSSSQKQKKKKPKKDDPFYVPTSDQPDTGMVHDGAFGPPPNADQEGRLRYGRHEIPRNAQKDVPERGHTGHTVGAGGATSPGAAPLSPASGERRDDMDELRRRLALLEERLADLETGAPPGSGRPGPGPQS